MAEESAGNTTQGAEGQDDQASATTKDGKESIEDEVDDDEPRLKYRSLTSQLAINYQNGDATSAVAIAGDRMILGTHNGNIKVFSIPDLELIRSYHAHAASTNAVSVSPFPLPLTNLAARDASPTPSIRSGTSSVPTPRKAKTIAPCHIGSASVDGHVCVQSMIDARDVTLRSFGRPVQALGLSPEYATDRSYLSGGLAGALVLTSGVQVGARSVASMANVGAAASGWLGSMGIGSKSGKDEIIHSGEGAISTIKWSRSTKFVAWVNEQGIKLMRSNLKLSVSDADLAWKRISHIDHPNRPGWEHMAGAWKAHVEWIDPNGLEIETSRAPSKHDAERLVVGWSGTVWIINVCSKGSKRAGSAEVETILRIDAIISGLTLYTANLLVVLAHVASDADSNKRSDASPAEVRMIDIDTKEEIAIAEPVVVERYQKLSAMDYHLAVMPIPRAHEALQKGAFDAISDGITTIGDGIWDATMYSTKILGSAMSMLQRANLQQETSSTTSNAKISWGHGMKLFIHSPYDCILATKPSPMDHFKWLESRAKYEEAWNFLNDCPKVLSSDDVETKSRSSDLVEDEILNVQQDIGHRWLQQLADEGQWTRAGKLAGTLLNGSSAWGPWIHKFAQANQIDSVIPSIPDRNSDSTVPPIVYEVTVEHFLMVDRARFCHFFDAWPEDAFDAGPLIRRIENILKRDEDRLLRQILAKMYVKAGRARDALHCYIRLQDSDSAMQLIKDYHLMAAVADDIPGFLQLSITDETDLPTLARLSAGSIDLLVAEARQGIVPPSTVVEQLKNKYRGPHPYLFFYLRALWNLEDGNDLIVDHADDVVDNFANFDRDLFMDFLRSSQAYDLSHASETCRKFAYSAELVLLLAKEGRAGEALRLIIDDLDDIRQAINFAKEQDDRDLWNDLLQLSMRKPSSIVVLLQEIGTAVNPLQIVQKIPLGMEIPGLRDGLARILKDFEIQECITKGAAQVLSSEISDSMARRARDHRQGLKFDSKKTKCAKCHHGTPGKSVQYLVTFSCKHTYHLSCLLDQLPASRSSAYRQFVEPDGDLAFSGSIDVGPKMDRARLLKLVLKDGCPLETALDLDKG